jgi:hypothetical protein
MADKTSTHSWAALGAALIVPIAFQIWFQSTYDFRNDDGTPDNALIRAIPALVVLALWLCGAALVGFRLFGDYLLARASPSLASPFVFAALVALPLPAWMYARITQSPDSPPSPELIAGAVYGYLFVSSLVGAGTQWVLIRRDRRIAQ